MSALGGIEVCLFGIRMLTDVLSELAQDYAMIKEIESGKNRQYEIVNCNGKKEQVDILVTDSQKQKIGFQKQADGSYRAIASYRNTEQKKHQEKLLNKIRQKYAYKTVMNDLKRKGYNIVEEKNVEDNTIRIVARRWK